MSTRRAAQRGLRLGALIVMSVSLGYAAELKKETLNAWDSYIAKENAEVKQRAAGEEDFFWADAEPSRFDEIRRGAAVVQPVGDHNPIRVPGGLIHHWISAVFIPNATIDDVLAITRDYSHYKDYFKPGVADAAAIMKSDSRDEIHHPLCESIGAL